ncbi:hypothetical protein Anapl_12525 [Anas platyrhynchos]|uniref:Uncharacterized protein n=1 Tax=Anas platyrhynchos TaxID=8839 RepID=R0J8N6_ANAPL|nr:hypothetical protein Anapl_12525 [Anas platyrhynchos]
MLSPYSLRKKQLLNSKNPQLQTKVGLVNVTNWESLELEAGKEQTLLTGRTAAPRNGWLSLTAALAGRYGMGASPVDTAQS